MSNEISFFKSIKFKLALWYSTLLFIFSIGFVFILNIIAIKYIENQPGNPQLGGVFRRGSIIREITETERILLHEARMEDLENFRELSFYSIIPIVLLSFVGGYVIADRNLSPLEKLNREMRMRNAGDLSSSIEFKDRGDEISELMNSFNSMSERIHRTFESQKEFVENVSHEIKTPLAIIQANLDSALEDKKISRDELEDILNESKKSVKSMNQLTEDLLLLSVLQHDIAKEMINLKDILNSCVKDAKKIANGFEILVDNNGKDVMVSGNEMLLGRAISNILENAVKYSGGKMVTVKVESRDGKEAVISIADDGVGIPKEKRKKIFERFYRLDKGRSKKEGGRGLGLAITSEIIKDHGGSIKVVDSEKGAKFEIRLTKA